MRQSLVLIALLTVVSLSPSLGQNPTGRRAAPTGVPGVAAVDSSDSTGAIDKRMTTDEMRVTLAGLPGVSVYVDSVSVEMIDKGMTADVFRVEIERRLLEAGVPLLNRNADEPVVGDPVLYVGITTLFEGAPEQCVYGIRVELIQDVRLERNPDVLVPGVPTWSVGGVGIHGIRWREAIVDDVLGFTEQFIIAFFEANPIVER